jgi:hypothetical protein
MLELSVALATSNTRVESLTQLLVKLGHTVDAAGNAIIPTLRGQPRMPPVVALKHFQEGLVAIRSSFTKATQLPVPVRRWPMIDRTVVGPDVGSAPDGIMCGDSEYSNKPRPLSVSSHHELLLAPTSTRSEPVARLAVVTASGSGSGSRCSSSSRSPALSRSPADTSRSQVASEAQAPAQVCPQRPSRSSSCSSSNLSGESLECRRWSEVASWEPQPELDFEAHGCSGSTGTAICCNLVSASGSSDWFETADSDSSGNASVTLMRLVDTSDLELASEYNRITDSDSDSEDPHHDGVRIDVMSVLSESGASRGPSHWQCPELVSRLSSCVNSANL